MRGSVITALLALVLDFAIGLSYLSWASSLSNAATAGVILFAILEYRRRHQDRKKPASPRPDEGDAWAVVMSGEASEP